MPSKVKIAAVFFVLLGAGLTAPTPRAQYLGPGIRTNIALTQQDLAIIRETVDTKIHGKAIGTSAHWSNPASGNYGKLSLVGKFTRNGQQCESVEYSVGTHRRPVRPEHYRLNSCLQPNGEWRLI
jgi:surface antigen